MSHPSTEWTVDMLLALPEDGQRHEIVDGELFVNPAPLLLHQRAAFRLGSQLDAYVSDHRIGSTLLSPADIILGDRTLVQPDVFVSALFDGRVPREWSEVKLLLAVEVLSASSQRADRIVKRRLYQRQRVPEYWIVDLDARLLSRWHPEDARPEEIDGRLEWQPQAGINAFVLDLPSFFATVFGEVA